MCCKPIEKDTWLRNATHALRRWVEAAGGNVACPDGIEVSPIVSYAGEGLHDLCAGRTFPAISDPLLTGSSGAAVGSGT